MRKEEGDKGEVGKKDEDIEEDEDKATGRHPRGGDQAP